MTILPYKIILTYLGPAFSSPCDLVCRHFHGPAFDSRREATRLALFAMMS